MNLIDMKQEQKAALVAAEFALTAAEQGRREMTASEQETYTNSMAKYKDLGVKIQARTELNTIRLAFPNGTPGIGTPSGTFNAPANAADFSPLRLAAARNPEYAKALQAFLCTGGKAHSEDLTCGSDGFGGYVIPGSDEYTRQRTASGSFLPKMRAEGMSEGNQGCSDAAGGYAIDVQTSQLIVPLALPDLGIWDSATVLPTATDIKIPQQLAFGTAALKSESSSGNINNFGGVDPTLEQTLLSAFMVGAVRTASWELLQDVQAFQQFIVEDLIKGQRIYEGSLLASGTGSAQPLGVFGNTGTGTGTAYELVGTSADGQTLLNSLFDVTSTLKGFYQANASWIMSRATGLTIRKAQMQANLFIPVATVDPDGTERILGRPVNYDVNAPALPTATTAGVVPILFGDFKQGYIIGVRGGAGINVKVLDQPLAIQGQLAILAYRRLDGRIRLSEAMQAVKISHS
jgi:HK97 family phage major capsid protein